jgi:hypothetical protein
MAMSMDTSPLANIFANGIGRLSSQRHRQNVPALLASSPIGDHSWRAVSRWLIAIFLTTRQLANFLKRMLSNRIESRSKDCKSWAFLGQLSRTQKLRHSAQRRPNAFCLTVS